MRPLIGVTTSELRPGALATLRRDGLPPHPEMALGTTYLQAVEAAGGIPVILAPTQLDAVPALVERLDGVCLSGGPDIDPFAYGAGCAIRSSERRPRSMASSSPSRARRTRRAAGAGHLPRRPGAERRPRGHPAPARRRPPPGRAGTVATHVLAVERARGWPRSPGRARNWRSTPSITRPSTSSARACASSLARADGIVEAIEDRTRTLVLGVQWHAESLIERAEHAALFEALVEATAHPRRLSAAA